MNELLYVLPDAYEEAELVVPDAVAPVEPDGLPGAGPTILVPGTINPARLV